MTVPIESSLSDSIRILFVGETWKGSSARSLREAISNFESVQLSEIGEDLYVPKGRSLPTRIAYRLIRGWQQSELSAEIERQVHVFRPDVLLVYKGRMVSARTLRYAMSRGVKTINVFPDYSPHAYGAQLRASIGAYDLVISTKSFHPARWRSTYGYSNRCVFVAHGYDSSLHLWQEPPSTQDIDVVMIAMWRPEYDRLLSELAWRLDDSAITVAIAGTGWPERSRSYPSHWQLKGPITGRAYGEFLRRGRIVLAPVNSEVVINGIHQPGDEDTTRSYELAAAWTFFLHRRTAFARSIYDESTEVPMWDDAAELAALIRRYLPLELDRRAFAEAAHLRAVPAYSIDRRAAAVVEHIRQQSAGMNSAEQGTDYGA